jgi:hypothetical protein
MVKKAKPTVAEACLSCRFGQFDGLRADAGFCRRYPPTPFGGEEELQVSFPVVSPEEWCGEYKGVEQ